MSIRCVQNSFHPNGLMAIHQRYGVKRFSTLCRIGGSGYKTLGSLAKSKSVTVKRRRAMWYHLYLPMDLWLGRGCPLNPYLKGYFVEYLRRDLRPRDLRVCPDEMFEMPGMKEFQEWSLLRGWVDEVMVKVGSLVRVCSSAT